MHACTHTHRQRALAKHENRAKGEREWQTDKRKVYIIFISPPAAATTATVADTADAAKRLDMQK